MSQFATLAVKLESRNGLAVSLAVAESAAKGEEK
jgi:hypothetical protein